MKSQWMLAIVIACTGQIAHGEPATTNSSTGTHIALRVNPFMDMHYFVRDIASRENAEYQKIQGIDKAVDAVRKVGEELGGSTAWGFVEGSLASCESVRDASDLVAQLPPSFNTRDGREIPVRGLIQRIVRAYEPLEPSFMQDIWPAHRRLIDEAHQRIEKELLPAQTACFSDIVRRLNMKDPEIEIPVCLVAKAPFPQGFTHRRKGGGAVCIIGVEGLNGSTMCEVVLHECIHALDIATEQSGSALQELRATLYRYKIKARSKEFHDIPHTLIFVQAADTVRAVIDPTHKAYGDSAGYYAKLPAISDAVKKAWKAHAEGSLGRDEALIQIARDATRSN